MSLSLLNLDEQQHKDEIVSLTEQVLDAKGIECDSKRYLAGKDVETWAANKKTMSDTQFHDMMQGISH